MRWQTVMRKAHVKAVQLPLVDELLEGEWLVFRKQASDHGAWRNFVVARRQLSPKNRKGMFYLGWNLDENRMARNHDAEVLVSHYPELYDAIRSSLQEIHSEPPL
jgi:hypothetical protein